MASTNHQYSNLAEESAKSEASAFVRPNPTVTRVGFIDLGSNSSRLTVVEFDRRGRVTVLNRVKSMVRLGEGAFETKKLQPQAMQRALSCLIEFADVCRSYGVSEVMAVGTAALRVATNSMDFVNEVKTKTGFDLQVISGDEEARLIRVGIWDSLPKTKDSFLFIDIGGGSTEISVSSREKISFLESLNIGCVMMTDAFKGNAQGKISSSVFAKMQQKALEKMQHILKKVERSKFAAAIASSGTAQALLALAQVKFGEQGGFAQKPAGIELKRSQIAAWAKSLAQMSAAEREKLPGLSPARAQVIVGGAAILLSILQALDLPCVYITPNNLQDGQVVDYVERHFEHDGKKENYWRKKSVKRLAKHYYCEKAHAKHMGVIALSLFEQASRKLKLFENQPGLSELMGYAARLHDIGIAISYDKHYMHGAYLVRYCPLLGFTEQEILTMARLVFWHSRPSGELPSFLAGTAATHAEKWAALSLFIAENLDRTHRSMAKEVKLIKKGAALSIEVLLSGHSPLEQASIEKIRKHSKKVLGEAIDVRFQIEDREIDIIGV